MQKKGPFDTVNHRPVEKMEEDEEEQVIIEEVEWCLQCV